MRQDSVSYQKTIKNLWIKVENNSIGSFAPSSIIQKYIALVMIVLVLIPLVMIALVSGDDSSGAGPIGADSTGADSTGADSTDAGDDSTQKLAPVPKK